MCFFSCWIKSIFVALPNADLNLFLLQNCQAYLHWKKVSGFPVPTAGCHFPNSPWPGIITSRLGTGKPLALFTVYTGPCKGFALKECRKRCSFASFEVFAQPKEERKLRPPELRKKKTFFREKFTNLRPTRKWLRSLRMRTLSGGELMRTVSRLVSGSGQDRLKGPIQLRGQGLKGPVPLSAFSPFFNEKLGDYQSLMNTF